ncbi:MAG: hypothetical protein IKK15_08245, partial [Akkermansia sp.]|nr:hypothetical protein [Akkermansia sp.]
DFSAVKTLSGGYKLGGTGTAAITGDSTLSFAADTTYANTTNLNAVDFSCIEVGEGTVASIATIKNAAGSLTKSGAGTLNIDSTMAMDTILLQGGTLNVKGITSSKGLAVHATSSGASMKVNGDLTLSALHVDMLTLEAGSPVLDIEGKLSGFGTDNVLKVVLNDYEKLENGSYVLAEMESFDNNLQLQYDAFATAPDGMIYELVLSGKSLVFNYRTLSEWVWEGTADGNEKAVWSDTSHDGWKADSETPSGQDVYFTAAGASEENGNGNVMISGTVKPRNIEMLGGEYTFSAASDGGDIQLTDGTLNIGSGAKLTMAMDNANLGGTTVLGGELVLQSADAIGNSVLKFNGGTLVYEEGITTDLSAQTIADTALIIQVKGIGDKDTVTWGDVDSAKNNSGVQAALTNGFEKTGAGHFILQVASPDSAVDYTGDLLVKEGKLTVKGTESITIAKDADITVDTELMVDSASQKSGSVAVDVAGNLKGAGTLSFGASTAADYRISGDNTQFKGEIQLADTEGKTLFADGMAMGGSDTKVHLNGATFSVKDGTQAVIAQLWVTEDKTSVLAAEDDTTVSAAPTGTGTLRMTGAYTATFSGAVDTFKG